jgi:hypothetical protein
MPISSAMEENRFLNTSVRMGLAFMDPLVRIAHQVEIPCCPGV